MDTNFAADPSIAIIAPSPNRGLVMNQVLLWADHVLPMTADHPVIENGAVVVDGRGRIEAVGEAQ